jgi:hypothetical protein
MVIYFTLLFQKRNFMKKLCLFLFFALPSFLFAQDEARLAIRVVLYRQPSMVTEIVIPAPLVSAKVTLIDKRFNDTLTGYTDENGVFIFPDIPPGIYYVKAEKEGYQVSNYYPVVVAQPVQDDAIQNFGVTLVPAMR